MVSSTPQGFNWNHARLFSQLLWVNTLRGDDSTGVFGVNKYGNVDYMKQVGHAAKLQDSNEWKDFRGNIFSDFHMVVGHNRKATRGVITDENAHPFVEKETILVHNGTLTNHKELTKEDVEVDSHAILHSIVERGYEETLKEIQGAFTLAWYDANDKTLRVIRNKERPLFIANTAGAWFFASEREMLELVLGRDDVAITDMTDCKPGTLYYWELEDKKNLWYKPLSLWSPSKSTGTNIVPFVPKNETTVVGGAEIETNKGYNNTDFPIGTKIIVNANRIQTFDKPTQQGHSDMIYGVWYFDEDVKVRAWVTPEEAEILEYDDDQEEDYVVQAEVTCVISKKGKITLVCDKVTPYKPVVDSTGREIYEDEFIFTNERCDDCRKPMTFKDAQAGKFEYRSVIDYDLLCAKCQ